MGRARGFLTLLVLGAGLVAVSPSTAHAVALQQTVTTVTVSPPAGPGGSVTWTVDTEPGLSFTGPVAGTGTWEVSDANHTLLARDSYLAGLPRRISTSGLAPGNYTLQATWTGSDGWGDSRGQATGTFRLNVTTTTVTVSPPAGPRGTLTWTVDTEPGQGFTGPVSGTGTWSMYDANHTLVGRDSYLAGLPRTFTTAGFAPGDYTVQATWTGSNGWADSTATATGTFLGAAGSLSVNVVDDSGGGQNGATFAVFTDPAGTVPATLQGGAAARCTASGGAVKTPATCTVGPLAAGSYYVRQTGATSGHSVDATIGAVQVSGGGTAVVAHTFVSPLVAVASKVDVTTSAGTVLIGGKVTIRAKVTSAGSPAAAGTVSFSVDGVAYGAPVPVRKGQARLEVTLAAVGAHTVTATYAGSAQAPTGSGSVAESVTYGVRLVEQRPVRGPNNPPVPIALELVNARGDDLSGSGITVTLAAPALSPNVSPQPTGAFAVAACTGHQTCYQYLLPRAPLKPRARYTLAFSASGDPFPHTVSFRAP